MNKKSPLSSLLWVRLVTKRFSKVDKKGRSAVTSKLAVAGICFGVMTLIVVMSVMNGFQMSFIKAIQEISSYHVRTSKLPLENEQAFTEYCENNKNILSATPFYEAQTLMTGQKGRESAAVIRAVPQTIYKTDAGFARELVITSGAFSLESKNSIVLGSILARNIGATVGSTVNLLVLSGGNDVELFSSDRNFVVTGIFTSGYSDINSSCSFIDIENAQQYFGANAEKVWGIKLKNTSEDLRIVSLLQKNFPMAKSESWREYNKSFFGTLRMEKNMLLLLVALIFVVVAINIYNGMRRLVFERRSEIAIFSALGASQNEIKAIFIMNGFFTGLTGALIGMVLGIVISLNTDIVFSLVAKFMYFCSWCLTAVTAPQNLSYVSENSAYSLYAQIPAVIFPKEVVLIVLFGIISPLAACWAASKNVLKLSVAEVLHNE